jgi:hypothetical protein
MLDSSSEDEEVFSSELLEFTIIEELSIDVELLEQFVALHE